MQSLERKKQITRLGFRNSSTPVFKSLGKKITLGQGKWQVIEHVFRVIERKKQMMRLKLGNSATPVFRPLLKKIICKSTCTAKVASNRAVSNRASFWWDQGHDENDVKQRECYMVVTHSLLV